MQPTSKHARDGNSERTGEPASTQTTSERVGWKGRQLAVASTAAEAGTGS